MKRLTRLLPWLVLAICLIVYMYFFGFRLPHGYQVAVSHAVQTNPYVAEFEKLYPDSEHFISYYTGTYGQPRWNSMALVNERYEVRMSFDIELDRIATRVVPIEEPMFGVNARRYVQDVPGGGQVIYYGPEVGVRIGPDEWEQLVEAQGDLAVLGFEVTHDSPVPTSTDPAPSVVRPAIPIDLESVTRAL